jgi:hypothetical protein
MARVVILSRTSQWGLAQDAKLMEQTFREIAGLKYMPVSTIDHMDPYQFSNPKPVDIQVHLEVPCRQAWPWAKVNIVVVNPEWWVNDAWDWALQKADWVIFKSPAAAALFPDVDAKRSVVIPWRTLMSVQSTDFSTKEEKFVYLVGGSKHKLAAAKRIVHVWKSSWPTLEIWGPLNAIGDLQKEGKRNIVFQTSYKSLKDREAAQRAAKYHCVASDAEGFGYTMAECAASGSLPLWCGLPVQDYMWNPVLKGVGRIPPLMHQHRPSEIPVEGYMFREEPIHMTDSGIEQAVQGLLKLKSVDAERIASAFQKHSHTHITEYRSAWKRLIASVYSALKKREQPFVPKRLASDEIPNVAVITLSHNRPKWFANMSRNILLSDYPSEKLTWIIVDDSDGMGRIDEQVQRFKEQTKTIRVEYVSITKKLAIGDKRNRGCKAAPADTDIFLMMDDDDHYPKSSIEARVAYLKQLKVGCVYCSTLPMYDCGKFISAMNVPPMDLSPDERVSEASLAFTRAFWEARPFDATISIAEGETFLKGRVLETAEIPPDGIIVSFLHGKNSTSRRVPESQEPNGCHYGFDDDYFTYLHTMATMAT